MISTRFAFAALFVTLVGAAGCEVIASIDRDKIPTSTGGGGSGGSGGNGGGGGAPECTDASSCPKPKEACLEATCDAGKCGTAPSPKGAKTASQTEGDCQKEQCDGKGQVEKVDDDGDVPSDDNTCTEDSCDGGKAKFTPKAAGASCGAGGKLQCDGHGKCVTCTRASDCGKDDGCKTFACNDGACTTENAPAGSDATEGQVDGDCKILKCDGHGIAKSGDDNSDVNVDGKDCTLDLCADGIPSNPPVDSGTSCDSGAGQCDDAGNCVECAVASDCPGEDDACKTRSCDAGKCGFSFQPNGHAIALQDPGDCKQNVCDGAGKVIPKNDDTDVPDDQNPCSTDLCSNGVASHGKAASGTACGTGLMCDDGGICAGCTLGTDCPGTDGECQTRTCTEGACGFAYAAAGVALAAQTVGDCQEKQCDGRGQVQVVAKDADVPADDGDACTGEACHGGFAVHPPADAGTACATGVCDGAGKCEACNVAADCPQNTGSECKVPTCSNHVCGTKNSPAGTVVATQTTGDCQQRQCNDQGAVIGVADNSDVPGAANACVTGACDAGAPKQLPKANGTACNDGDACTQSDSCQAGVCTGSNPIVCNALDQCHVSGTCNSTTGVCSNPSKPNGAGCDDGNLCTLGDSCQAGSCTAGAPKTCAASDPCHDAGVCDSGTGTCSNPPKTDGASCDDGDACTVGDTCQAGACSAGPPKTCAASDQCHVSGTCDHATGTCSNPPAADDTACSDGSLCTTGETCQAGACTGGTAVVCPPPADACHLAGACDGGTGVCSTPTAPDGTSCGAGAICASGACVVPPTVLATSPVDATSFYAPTISISVTFSAAMAPASLTTKGTLDNGACSGAVQLSSDGFVTCAPLGAAAMNGANTVATFVPTVALSYGERYAIKVTTGATSATGVHLAADFTTATGFTTALPYALVISQVYGGGGNASAPYKNDFIELHNNGATPLNLSGFSVQYASTTGTSWASTALSGVIQPGGYYLVQEASGGAVGASLPAPDATGTSNMGGTAGKVALVAPGTAALSGACPTGLVDFVGFGTGTNCFEGAAPTPAPSNTTAVIRGGSGCTDTNGNSVDFTAAAPNPRNTSTAALACAFAEPVLNETLASQGSGIGTEIDYCALVTTTPINVGVGVTTGAIRCEVYEGGITDLTGGDSAQFDVEIGYGPRTANPESQTGWVWVAAPFVTDAGNNDEYEAPFTAPAAGSYSYACRVKWHAQAAPTYCDIGGAGSNTGLQFDVTELGAMTTN